MYISLSKNDAVSFSYRGGKPMLPTDVRIPVHPDSGSQMTFFFQVLLPEWHKWAGKLISVFCVTDDFVLDRILPEMVVYNESGYNVDSDCIQFKQDFFKIIVSNIKQCTIKDEYKEVLRYQSLEISSCEANSFGFIGKKPKWLVGDESPLTLDGEAFFDFLFQINIDLYFPKLESAPKQKTENFEESSGIRDSYIDDYSLFAGNAVYFFGEKDSELVYMVSQS
ncbi:hypothetical protein [Vibrio cholerae]